MTGVNSELHRVERFLKKEFIAAWPIFVFFLIAFLLLILLIKLALAEFSIEVTVLSNATVGAAIAAKTALVLDETPLVRRLEHYHRIVAVTIKTLFYSAAGLTLGYIERFLEAFRKVQSFDGAIHYVICHPNHDRLFAWVLGISMVFALYFAFFEISSQMGEEKLWALFFESPAITSRSNGSPSLSARN